MSPDAGARGTVAQPSVLERVTVGTLVALWLAAVLWSATVHAPNVNEPAHLCSAYAIYQLSRFDIYPVNPPLSRIVAGLGSVWLVPEGKNLWESWTTYVDRPDAYTVFPFAIATFSANLPESLSWLRWARVALALACGIGPIAVWSWSRKAHGPAAGLLAVLFYVLNPELLHWSGCLNPDGLTAAMAAAAGWAYFRYREQPGTGRAAAFGLTVGLGLLTKFTVLLLAVFYLVVELVEVGIAVVRRQRQRALERTVLLVFAAAVACTVVYCGYAGTARLQTLGSYQFRSDSLRRLQTLAATVTGGVVNRLPVPLPDAYVLGLDLQLHDTRVPRDTWVAGRRHNGGVWYFYLYGLMAKLPVAFWLCFAWRTIAALLCPRGGTLRATLLELGPVLLVLATLSYHKTLTVHLRYTTPVLPYLIVWTSGLAAGWRLGLWRPLALAGLLSWQIWSVASVAPHFHGHLNELVGGSKSGYLQLAGPSVSGGEDYFFIRELVQRYRDAGRTVYALFQDPCGLGSHWPIDVPRPLPPDEFRGEGPPAGIYIIDPHRYMPLYPNVPTSRVIEYTRHMRPIATLGAAVLVYEVTPEESARLARILWGTAKPRQTQESAPGDSVQKGSRRVLEVRYDAEG